MRRLRPALARGLLGIPLLAGTEPSTRGLTRSRVARVARASLVVLPRLLVVVALLAAADPVFARLLVPDVDVVPVVRHVVLTVLGAAAVVAVVAAAAGDADDGAPRRGSFGVLEVTTMLGLVAAVIGLFSLSQLLAMTGAGRRVVAESPPTSASAADGTGSSPGPSPPPSCSSSSPTSPSRRASSSATTWPGPGRGPSSTWPTWPGCRTTPCRH